MTMKTQQTEKRMSRRQFLRAGYVNEDMQGCLGCLGMIAIGGTVIGSLMYATRDNNKPDNSTIEFYRQPVDQIFRDHDGYRLYHSNESGRVVETKLFNWSYSHVDGELDPSKEIRSQFKDIAALLNNGNCITIFQDLSENSRGYVNFLRFMNRCQHQFVNAEIHMPRGSRLSPGNETYGGKHKTHSQMSEVDDNGIAREQGGQR